MFTGIIKVSTKPIKITKKPTSMVITFPTPHGWRIEEGESINIDGICSTVIDVNKKSFSVFYMAETLKKTSLRSLNEDHVFNLERSLKASDLMGGHFVSGHVDTTGTVTKVKSEGESKILTVSIQNKFTKYIVYKGPVAVSGVSLTIVLVNKTSFAVSLIPYTLSQTNLGNLTTGDLVNIEVDMLAKYIEKLRKN